MIQKNSTERLLDFFFQCPTKQIHLRELSRETKITMPSLLASIQKLEKEELLFVNKGKALTLVKANIESKLFIRLKKVHNLEQLYVSGLVDHLYNTCRRPQTIACFGSYSRGEDIETSDIDLAVIAGEEKEVNLDKFEKILSRRISVHFVNLSKVSEEFKSNLYNGIVLEGAL